MLSFCCKISREPAESLWIYDGMVRDHSKIQNSILNVNPTSKSWPPPRRQCIILTITKTHIFPNKYSYFQLTPKSYLLLKFCLIQITYTIVPAFVFLIGIHFMQDWSATTRHEANKKKKHKKIKAYRTSLYK